MESNADSVVVEKLVEVQLPPDSATIRALLECDENGKVVLNWLDIANSKNAQAQLTIDSLGNLLAKMKTQPDTVYLPAKEVVISKRKSTLPGRKGANELAEVPDGFRRLGHRDSDNHHPSGSRLDGL